MSEIETPDKPFARTVLFLTGYQAGLEAAAGVLREWASHYPTDIFPEDGQSVDCQSAAFARHLCREVEKDIRALAAPADEQAAER